jgi:hypothetical protein
MNEKEKAEIREMLQKMIKSMDQDIKNLEEVSN